MLRRLTPAAATAACLSVALAAQTPTPPERAQQPTFRTEANFIRVDVFPMRDGKPLRDLGRGDFELLEDGVPQKIETFEFVQVRASGPQDLRAEPNTIRESRDALGNPRARVFVLFLDVPHVTMHGTWTVREPLVRLLDRILGDEDLVGIMTPTMAASDIVFARKTQVIAGGLRDRWPWGERFSIQEDEREKLYAQCYPWPELGAVRDEMKHRRRERLTLRALSELVTWLGTQREERKAILTISEGWRLYKPNTDLTRPRTLIDGRTEPVPGPEPVGVGADGRLRLGQPHPFAAGNKTDCDRDRLALSLADHDRDFRELLGEANRANASFYTVDPRGLPVYDTPIGPAPPPPPSVDFDNLRHRLDTLRVLADNTDGLAVQGSNDIEKGLRRMAEDLTTYYLLGYYSTNARLDGRFREIKVRVTQPGVDVRARRGYRAATREEIESARKATLTPLSEATTAARGALEPLARIRATTPLRTRAVAVKGSRTVWVTGELARPAAEPTIADVTVTVDGQSTSARGEVGRGQRGFVSAVTLPREPAGALDVRVRVAAAGDAPAAADMVRIEPSAGLPPAVLFRRGPATGNRLEAAGDPLFSRTERARLEVPAMNGVAIASGRVLDRNGAVIELPVTLGERADGDVRWLTADITLAPLAAGDYVVELSGSVNGREEKLLTGIRVGR